MFRKLFLIAITVSFALPISCKKTETKVEKNIVAETQEDVQTSNKLVVKRVTVKGKKNKAEYSFTADFPIQGPAALLQVLQKRIYTDALSETEANGTSIPKFSASAAQANPLTFFTKLKNGLLNEWGTYEWPQNADINCILVANTSHYATYSFSGNLYMGGAHGMPWDYTVTYDAATGKELTLKDIFVASKLNQVKLKVRQAIKTQYYLGKLKQHATSGYNFDLPANAPALTPKGVAFYYGAYEIGPYVEGMPTCVIPYAQLRPYMTQKALKMIGQ